jgi:hypothetical protein
MTNRRLQDTLQLLQMMQNWKRFPIVVGALSEAAQLLIRREIVEQASAGPSTAIPEGTYGSGDGGLRLLQESDIDSRPDEERREFLRGLSEEEGSSSSYTT